MMNESDIHKVELAAQSPILTRRDEKCDINPAPDNVIKVEPVRGVQVFGTIT